MFPTANGRARFAAVPYVGLADSQDARYPLSLNTGRLRDHWHGMSRTARAPRLFGHVPEPALGLHPRDAERRGIAARDLVELSTRRGRMILPWQPDDSLRSGQAFIAMHWGPEFVSGGVNLLTNKAFDPVSRQPELKHSALAVQRAELPWQAVLVGWFDAGRAQTLRTALLASVQSLAFASCVPFGRERHGLMLRLADTVAPAPEIRAALLAAFGLDAANVLRYDDPVRHHARRLRLSGHRLESMALLGSTVGQDWLVAWLKDEVALELPPLVLLRPSDKAPAAMAPAGRIICNCFGVSERTLERSANTCGAATPLLEHWQRELQCGTSCGSCLPELEQRAARCPVPPSSIDEPSATAAVF